MDVKRGGVTTQSCPVTHQEDALLVVVVKVLLDHESEMPLQNRTRCSAGAERYRSYTNEDVSVSRAPARCLLVLGISHPYLRKIDAKEPSHCAFSHCYRISHSLDPLTPVYTSFTSLLCSKVETAHPEPREQNKQRSRDTQLQQHVGNQQLVSLFGRGGVARRLSRDSLVLDHEG